MYAIDSLRQLATKFLEKEELANYNFQKDFFKPFEYIITNSQEVQIRELIIRCLSNIILSRSQNIKSGWKSMFIVFAYSAADSERKLRTCLLLINLPFQLLSFNWDSISWQRSLINISISFLSNSSPKFAIALFHLLKTPDSVL